MGVTIKDVASAAGVSVATASYALNGTGPVSQERLRRVLEAARTLGYVPNGNAKALQAKRNGVVGYFAYSLSGPFFSQVLRGIEETFDAAEEEMIACSCSAVKKKVTRFLSERMVDGTIVFGEHMDNDLILRVAGSNCPVVLMDRELTGEHISSITIDNQKCAYEVGKYIHSLGFRRLGCLMGNGPDGIRRESGFLQAVEEFGLQIQEDCVFHCDFLAQKAYNSMLQWLQTKPQLPEILIAFNDEMAIGAMNALQEMGYRIPEDISVIGMDDIPESGITSPKLTTFHLPIYEHGAMAAKLLLKMLRESAPSTATVLSGHIVERESCRKPERIHEE